MGQVLLTFDVEEFDIPLEYGCKIDLSEQLQLGKKGLDSLMPLMEQQAVLCTLFTTANFALHFPDAIRQLARRHEIASHTFYHSSFQNTDLAKSKQLLENICAKPVRGLRMPRMQKIDATKVLNAGYVYDSSVNPTWLPGRYNNLNKPRVFYKEKGLIRLPASVSPLLRLPLFWLAFKNYPYTFFRRLCYQCLKKDGYICLYFHPWEFITLDNYKLPGYVKKLSGEPLLKRLDKLLTDLKKDYEFITVQQFLETNKLISNM